MYEYNIVDTALGEQIRRDDNTFLKGIYRGKAQWVSDWVDARGYKNAQPILDRILSGEIE